MWERLKFTERFNFVNQSKVRHVVVDDAVDMARASWDHW